MEPKFIDCHCHIFNRNILFNHNMFLRILFSLPDILFDDEAASDKKLAALKEDKNRVRILNVIRFLDVALKSSEEKVYHEMLEVYENDYAIVPLMFDLDQCFEKGNPSSMIEPLEFFVSAEMNAESLKIKHLESIANLAAQTRSKDGDENFYPDVELVQQLHESLQNHNNTIQNHPEYNSTDGFESQIDQLRKLKNDNPQGIYPFFVIDPRREGIIDKFMNEIYPEQIFTGVKLYSPNGYSPTDPQLMNPGGLYDFCAQNHIPIITHNSFGGFASPLDNIQIVGDIYQNNQVTSVNGRVEFLNIKHGASQMIKDKAEKLNHPVLWEKVLQTYPTLRLDLAHFGLGNKEWTKKIYEMLNAPDDNNIALKYPNLYTDLSCCTDIQELKDIKSKYYDPAPDRVKKKFLFGSDFFLDLLYINSLKNYVTQFTDVFATDYEQIAQINPMNFLKIH